MQTELCLADPIDPIIQLGNSVGKFQPQLRLLVIQPLARSPNQASV
ncbi:MAG: hypothetical protein SGI77_08010 [Pirellulaceae bacterium]|nr:hypothetical protein [Pirellulaceae bacterium]